MNKYIKLLLSMPKTLYINFRILPLKEAVRLPILAAYNAKCHICRGGVQLPKKISFAMIRIGFAKGSFNLSDGKKTMFKVHNGRSVYLMGNVQFAKDHHLWLATAVN